MGLGAVITWLGPLCTKYNLAHPFNGQCTDHHCSIMSLIVGDYDNQTIRP